MTELKEHPEYNVDTKAEILAGKPLMIIGAEFDTCAVVKNHGEYLANCIREYDPADFEYQCIPSNHSFVDKRLTLAEMVLFPSKLVWSIWLTVLYNGFP